jgi:hypothetical protein
MAYIILSVPKAGTAPDEAEAFRKDALAVFKRSLHGRIATEVVAVDHDVERSKYLSEGGDPEKWPEWVGSGFDPVYKVPVCNAVVFAQQDLSPEEHRMALDAFSCERMVGVRLSDGRFRRATGLTGLRLTVDT